MDMFINSWQDFFGAKNAWNLSQRLYFSLILIVLFCFVVLLPGPHLNRDTQN